MEDTAIFENFLDTKHGRRVWNAFLKTKKGIENPANFITSKIGLKSRSSYLEIGGGIGEKTIDIADKLGCRQIDFLEPSRKMSGVFAQHAKKSHINFRVFNTSFEKFQSDRKYQLITSIHSWYYIELESIDKVLNILNKGGVACIFLDSESDIIKRVHDICDKFMGFRSNSIEDVAEYLDKRNIKYNIYYDKRELTGLIKDDKLTPKARTIISLIAYRKWDKIPESAKEEVRKMFIKSGKNDRYPIKRCLITIKK